MLPSRRLYSFVAARVQMRESRLEIPGEGIGKQFRPFLVQVKAIEKVFRTQTPQGHRNVDGHVLQTTCLGQQVVAVRQRGRYHENEVHMVVLAQFHDRAQPQTTLLNRFVVWRKVRRHASQSIHYVCVGTVRYVQNIVADGRAIRIKGAPVRKEQSASPGVVQSCVPANGQEISGAKKMARTVFAQDSGVQSLSEIQAYDNLGWPHAL